MIFQHHRFQIWNKQQHPFNHEPGEFTYASDSLPGVTTMGAALDYIVAVLYPQSKPAVANQAALPAVGNTLNDMRVVSDDGDGKAASYRWEQREGEASPSWHKIYDVDWGTDSILQAWGLKTQDTYVFRFGYDDVDSAGVPVVGSLSGQVIYGGKTAGTNLTLFANSGDGVGAGTGYIQFGDQVRPTSDNTVDLGTTANRFKKVWSYAYQAGTLVIADGSITDTDGSISFGSTNLSTTGTGTFGTLVLGGGSITDTTGDIDFGNENLTTTGIVTADSVSAMGAASSFLEDTTIGTLTFGAGAITDSSGTISFDNEHLETSGNITSIFGYIKGVNLKTATLDITGNTLTATVSDLVLAAGVNDVSLSSNLLATTGTFSGDLTVGAAYSFILGDLTITTGSVTTTSGDLSLQPFTNILSVDADIIPNITSTYDLGATASLFTDIYFSGGLKNATQTLSNATLFSLRDINAGVATGMSLFWDGAKWVASAADTEITHSTVSGLTTGDAGHTQFALLAGRAGGQTIQGGTAASENLTLESTSHATKGYIYFNDSLLPVTDASYSGGWSGTDIGSPSKRIRNVYSVGEFKGLCLENLGSTPASSSQNVGRLIWNTADKLVYVDNGVTVQAVGASTRYEEDTVWNGSDTTKAVTVTTLNMDARKAVWQFKDNTNNYETIYAKITATSSTAVTIAVNVALPAGTYRLVGVQ